MIPTRYLHDDNRLHTEHLFGDTIEQEFDYDDPDFMDLELYESQAPWVALDDLRYLRDFILNCSLYVIDLESAIGEEHKEFWEAREHAYRIISSLLSDLYRFELD